MAFLPPLMFCNFSGPRCEVTRLPTCPFPTTANSIDEPPMSQIKPLWHRANPTEHLGRIILLLPGRPRPEGASPVVFQHLGTEIRAIAGVAHSGGGNGGQGGKAHTLGQQLKPGNRRQRAGATFGVQDAGFTNATPQCAHDFFVVEIGRAAGGAVKHHHANGI